MTGLFAGMTAAFALARQPGRQAPPSKLLAHVQAGPPASDAQPADDEALVAVLDGEYPFLRYPPSLAPNAADLEAWAALLRWLIGALRAWSPAADPEDHR